MMAYFVTPSDADHAWVCFPDKQYPGGQKDAWDKMITHIHQLAEQVGENDEHEIEIHRREVCAKDCEICDKEDCVPRLMEMVQ